MRLKRALHCYILYGQRLRLLHLALQICYRAVTWSPFSTSLAYFPLLWSEGSPSASLYSTENSEEPLTFDDEVGDEKHRYNVKSDPFTTAQWGGGSL